MKKFDVFINEGVQEFNSILNAAIGDEVERSRGLFVDPVLCLTLPQAIQDGDKIHITSGFKIMERADLPPVIRVCDE